MPSSSPFFFGWDKPWLPRLAEHLLLKSNADLSKTVVVLPGRRAGRRLLELLAVNAQGQSKLLFPPMIMTLEEAIHELLDYPNDLPLAGPSIVRLAWRQAALQLTAEELQKIQLFPEELIAAQHAHAATLAEKLSMELGKAGFSIEEVLQRHMPFFPETAEREEPRWKALAQLQKNYQKILFHWGYIDRSEILRKKLLQGQYANNYRVLVAGIVDVPPLFISFFKKIDPEIIIIAPEEHAAGFDHYGKMIPTYWLAHPVDVPDETLVPCQRSHDQARQVWQLISTWKKDTNSIVIVAPEREVLGELREIGAVMGFPTRWAGGGFFQGSSLFVLLKTLKNFLDRFPHEPPSLAAVANLLRHPITATKLSTSLNISSELLLRELDDWEREHLALVLEEKHLKQFHKEQTLGVLLNEVEKNFIFALSPEPLEKVLKGFRALLLYLLGQQNVRRSDPEGHFFLTCLEKLMVLIEELEKLSRSTKLFYRSTELLSLFLEILSKESIPELEQPQAIEMIGWLEAAAEDVLSLVCISFYEGAIPAVEKNDPLLSARLRKRLGLGSSQEQLARDHYYLQLILASRQQEGGVAIFAPRYNARHEPVRPSRLLLQGCSEKKLPQRILTLTQPALAQNSDALKTSVFSIQQTGDDSCKKDNVCFLQPAACQLQLSHCHVTSLRTYLKSPRLFYFKHVLKLREVLEAPVEMTAQQFGVLLHRVLGAFSAEASLQKEKRETVFCDWLEQTLEKAFQWQFGENPAPSVFSQKGELLRALKGFARAEAAHREEGWRTIVAEGKYGSSSLLEEKIILDDGKSLVLQGRIDRLDWHPEKKRWLLLDYKTSHHQAWKKETPNRMHFQCRGEIVTWHDLQLPLYLKLVKQLEIIQNSGLPLPTIENTDLCFFQLPIYPEAAGISEPFDANMIEPAWKEAHRLVGLILEGKFEELGILDATISPTWTALCGVA